MVLKNVQVYFLMAIAMIFWGLNVPTLKIIVSHFPPISITALRIFVAGMTVILFLTVTKKFRWLSFHELKFVILGGLLNILGHHYFLSIGLTKTTSTNGGLILGSGPLLTAILATILLRRVPTIIQIFGFLIGSSGVAFILLAGDKGVTALSTGDLYVFLSIFSQALSFVFISRITKSIEPWLLTGYMLMIGSISLFIIGLIKEPAGLNGILNAPLYFWIFFFCSAILATAIGNLIYNFSISKIGAAETSIFLNLNTFFALVGSVLFLNEVITIIHVLGFILIIIGILCGSGALEEIIQRRKKYTLRNKSHSESI